MFKLIKALILFSQDLHFYPVQLVKALRHMLASCDKVQVSIACVIVLSWPSSKLCSLMQVGSLLVIRKICALR